MYRLILFAVAGVLPLGLFGQEAYVSAVSQKFQIMPSNLPSGEVLDSTFLVARYRFVYPSDNFKDGFDLLEDELTLEVAATMSKTYSQNLYLMDRNLTYQEQNTVRFRLDYNDFEVFNLVGEAATVTQRRIPYSRILQPTVQVVEYRDELQPAAWSFSDRCDTIAGYPCMQATSVVAGRQWRVWYTVDIPVTANLWLFHGLPGLILKADDDGMFRFDCTSVASARAHPALRLASGPYVQRAMAETRAQDV